MGIMEKENGNYHLGFGVQGLGGVSTCPADRCDCERRATASILQALPIVPLE